MHNQQKAQSQPRGPDSAPRTSWHCTYRPGHSHLRTRVHPKVISKVSTFQMDRGEKEEESTKGIHMWICGYVIRQISSTLNTNQIVIKIFTWLGLGFMIFFFFKLEKFFTLKLFILFWFNMIDYLKINFNIYNCWDYILFTCI